MVFADWLLIIRWRLGDWSVSLSDDEKGKVHRAFYSISRVDVDAKRMSGIETLSGLFRVIDEAYAGSAAEVKFKANAELGYLEYLYIDFNARVADEELIYYISGFRSPAPDSRPDTR